VQTALEVALITGEESHTREALSLYQAPTTYLFTARMNDRNQKVNVAMVSLMEGQEAAAASAYENLLPYVGSSAVGMFRTSLPSLLGMLAHLGGSGQNAIRHYEDALEYLRQANYRPQVAWNCLYLSEVLAAADGRAERERVAALQDEAILIARDLSMRPLLERVLARREILRA